MGRSNWTDEIMPCWTNVIRSKWFFPSQQMKRILVYLAWSQSLLLGTWESILYCSKPNSFHCHEEKSNLVQLYCNWIADSFLLRCKTFEAPPRMKTFVAVRTKLLKLLSNTRYVSLQTFGVEREKVIIYVNFKCIKFGYL